MSRLNTTGDHHAQGHRFLLLASAVATSGAAFARGASNSDSNQGAIAQSEVDFPRSGSAGLRCQYGAASTSGRGAATQMTPAQAAISQGFAPINQ